MGHLANLGGFAAAKKSARIDGFELLLDLSSDRCACTFC
jgi:hypothetical protein